MKKVVPILLICIYSIATMGFSIHRFYCCGKLKSVSVTIAGDSQHQCGKDNVKNGCCKNKSQFFKVKYTHVTTDGITSPGKPLIGQHPCKPSLHNIIFTSQKITVANRSNAPPIHTGIPVYVYNCVFRI